MKLLNIIIVVFWIYIAIQSFTTLRSLKDQGLSRREITSITILLLCGLNISRGLISTFIDQPIKLYPGQLLLEYFYIGSSIFQILLCNMVLKYIENKPNEIITKD